MTGTRSSATVRHSVSSQNANRSASEPPPRATTITSTSSQAARSCSARVIAGAAWRSWTGANAHTSRPAQPRRRRPASTSSRALPPSPVTTPMHARQRRARQALLRLEQPLGGERAAQPLELGEQVALAGDAQLGDREGERRRGRARAGVEVAAAGGDDDARRRRASRGRARPSPCATSSTGARPSASRSSNHTFARPTLRPNTSPNTCTRAKPRSRSRSAAAYWPTGHGPDRRLPGMPVGGRARRSVRRRLRGAGRAPAGMARCTRAERSALRPPPGAPRAGRDRAARRARARRPAEDDARPAARSAPHDGRRTRPTGRRATCGRGGRAAADRGSIAGRRPRGSARLLAPPSA